MAKKVKDIFFGPACAVTALGSLPLTVEAMGGGRGGLRFDHRYGMITGAIDGFETIDGYSRFESLIIGQIKEAVADFPSELLQHSTQLVLSTTKGNIDKLEGLGGQVPEDAYIYCSARRIAEYFKLEKSPIVISNACISGVSAFVVANNLIQETDLEHVLVVGCDALCEFITAGFASFKSISENECRPYDDRRDGLNLGEACGAVLLTTDPSRACRPLVRLAGGAVSNDANHISGPSRTGDGLFFAIQSAMDQAQLEPEQIGFVNAHGTATRYNDEMESKALAWAMLDDKPLNSFKGYIGHTLGASGVVETILCLEQLRGGRVFGTRGYEVPGTPHQLALSASGQTFGLPACVKTASGFGGCNAAIVLDMNPRATDCPTVARGFTPVVAAEYTLPQSDAPFAEFIRAEFKKLEAPYMKFYKMSDLSKALYVAVENLLLQGSMEDADPARRAIIMSNRSASLEADAAHQAIVDRKLPEGASPAVFVYTLPNVATGEVCIKHKIMGDNTFFIEDSDSGLAENYARLLVSTGQMDAVICGWCDYLDEKWNVNVKLIKK